MKVLVTGGAGFIGSHSVDRLLAEGAEVRVLDNFSTGKRDNLSDHPQLEIITGDIRNPEQVAAAMDGMSHVLHLAAQVSVATSVADPVTSSAINITGFLNVLDCARRQGVQRMVYASSAAVYGMPSQECLDESVPTQPISPYGLEKSINDQYAELYRQLYGFSAMGNRYFNVFGPRQDPSSQYSGVISIFTRRLREQQPLTIYGDGLQTRDFIYVGDVAAANVRALKSDAQGVCNVATGQSVTLLTMLDTMAQVAGAQPDVSFAPARAGDIRYSATQNERLQNVLGLREFTPLHEGLTRLWQSGG